MKKGLILQGGWQEHEPEMIANRFGSFLNKEGWKVEIENSLRCLEDDNHLSSFDLLIFCWTMGEITPEQLSNVRQAVAKGTGLAGCHGGLCDAFRNEPEWHFMTGGQWVAHPGGNQVTYKVEICRESSEILKGIEDFTVCSEQYYLHVDPAVEVLATTRFFNDLENSFYASNKSVDMPVAWTKYWGSGRIFYSSLGHNNQFFDNYPMAEQLIKQGLLWAGKSKEYAEKSEY